MWGTMDDPMMVPPKGEFFCKNRVEWMPEIPGMYKVTRLGLYHSNLPKGCSTRRRLKNDEPVALLFVVDICLVQFVRRWERQFMD